MKRRDFILLTGTVAFGLGLGPGCSGGLDLYERRVASVYRKQGLSRRTIELGEHTLRYFIGETDGPAVVLVHGFGAVPHWQWVRQVEALAGKYRLVVPDLLYFGGSSSRSGRHDLDVQSEALRDLLRHEEIDHAAFVGVSYGGFVSHLLASDTAPAMVERLALIDSPPGVLTLEDVASMNERLGVDDAVQLLVPEDLDDLRRLLGVGYHRPPRVPNAILQDVLEQHYAPYRDDQRDLLRSMLSNAEALSAKIHPFDGPTLLVWGEHDPLFPLDLARRQQAACRSGTQLIVIDDTAHAPNLEAHDEVDEALLDFLGQG